MKCWPGMLKKKKFDSLVPHKLSVWCITFKRFRQEDPEEFKIILSYTQSLGQIFYFNIIMLKCYQKDYAQNCR